MDIPGTIQLAATLIEVAIAVVACLIAWKKNKIYGWFIGITFGLFVIFDVARIFMLDVSGDQHALILLIACISMLYAVYLIWKKP